MHIEREERGKKRKRNGSTSADNGGPPVYLYSRTLARLDDAGVGADGSKMEFSLGRGMAGAKLPLYDCGFTEVGVPDGITHRTLLSIRSANITDAGRPTVSRSTPFPNEAERETSAEEEEEEKQAATPTPPELEEEVEEEKEDSIAVPRSASCAITSEGLQECCCCFVMETEQDALLPAGVLDTAEEEEAGLRSEEEEEEEVTLVAVCSAAAAAATADTISEGGGGGG